MKCKCGDIIMNEFSDYWECDFCGYRLAKLNDLMSPRLQAKIIREMKGYVAQKKGEREMMHQRIEPQGEVLKFKPNKWKLCPVCDTYCEINSKGECSNCGAIND
jgi:uncharacterized paraquat-inducible protein A